MSRSLCIVVLLPSLVIAQSREAVVPAAVLPSDHGRVGLRQGTYYSEIRRGTSEQAAVELVLHDARYFFTSPRSPMPGLVPLKLELEGEDGITITKIKYPPTFKLVTKRGRVHVADSGVIQFRIRANRDVPLGAHLLKGRLTFQLATAEGASGSPDQIDVQIPVTVVEQNAKVTKSSWARHRGLSRTELTLLILLSPLLVVIFIPMALACSLGSSGACM